MGISAATLNGHRATSARVNIPKWGCWYAEVQLDGEVALKGSVSLAIADLTLIGTVLSGGASKGRSSYRIVSGAGGWGRTIAKKSYASDAGVKVSAVLEDGASAAGETIDTSTISASDRVGPGWTRPEDPACRLLELLVPAGWYVDEGGTTRLGARPASTLGAGVTHGPVDLARGTVTLAAESIVGILPGLVVDGLDVVDVLHEINAEGGLRSTVWGAETGDTLGELAALIRQLDPGRKFRGVSEYRVVTLSGDRLNLQPVRVSAGMPDLARVVVRPGVPGMSADAALGSRVLVDFIDTDPARPCVRSFEDVEGSGFIPTTLKLQAGNQVAGEHVMTTEACVLFIYNVLVALCTAAGGGPLLAVTLQPLLAAAIGTAIAAQTAPAPPTSVAQSVASGLLQAGFATGVAPANTMFAGWTSALELLATKIPNDSGLFPSMGSAAVEAG